MLERTESGSLRIYDHQGTTGGPHAGLRPSSGPHEQRVRNNLKQTILKSSLQAAVPPGNWQEYIQTLPGGEQLPARSEALLKAAGQKNRYRMSKRFTRNTIHIIDRRRTQKKKRNCAHSNQRHVKEKNAIKWVRCNAASPTLLARFTNLATSRSEGPGNRSVHHSAGADWAPRMCLVLF